MRWQTHLRIPCGCGNNPNCPKCSGLGWKDRPRNAAKRQQGKPGWSGHCIICRGAATRSIHIAKEIDGQHRVGICSNCHKYFLRDCLGEEKANVVCRGLEIAQTYKLHTPFAMNVAIGRYSIEEAKRRTRLLEIERRGGSVDAFAAGRRLPGSFGSRQK